MSMRFLRYAIPVVGLLIALVMTVGGFAGSAAANDTKIVARYDIAFNGLSIGTFRFESDLNGNSYLLRAGARISLLNGILFDWNARTESAGRLTSGGPRPERYTFGFESADQAGSVRLRFNGSSVDYVNIDPPPEQNRVPIRNKHMRGVIDPLSAVIGLSKFRRPVGGAQSCDEALEIFDGKMRYDITLRYKQTRRVSSAGYNGPAHVCRAKFRAIAGHKPGKEDTGFLERSNDIEVWLIPARKAKLYVPYYIYLPLPFGSASLTVQEFRVESAREGSLTVIGAS